MKKIIGRIFGIFTDDIGVDLGTANTLICAKKKGIILNEPSVVAITTRDDKIFSVGAEAKKMIGRTPPSIKTIRPVTAGVVNQYGVSTDMLNTFYKLAYKKSSLSAPKVVMCVPVGATQVEKRAIVDLARETGAREVYLIEEPMAAAIGMGVEISKPVGNMIVDLGGGTAEIAVIALEGVVEATSCKIAGDNFDREIMDYVRSKHNLSIGESTAEFVKKTIGCFAVPEEEESITVSGRYTVTGLPKDIVITSSEMVEVLTPQLNKIIEEIKVILERTPADLTSDIRKTGIYLAGGGALQIGRAHV